MNKPGDATPMTFYGEFSQAEAQRDARRISLTLGFALIPVVAAAVYANLNSPDWRSLFSLGVAAALMLTAFFSARLAQSGRHVLGVIILLSVLMASAVLVPLATAGLGLYLSVIAFMIVAAISAQVLPPHLMNRIIFLGTLVSAASYVLDLTLPYERRQASAAVQTVLPIASALAFAVLLWLFLRQFRRFSLLTKLVIPFVLVALLSIGVLAGYNYFTTRDALISASNQTLRAAAQQTASQVDGYLSGIADGLTLQARLPAVVDYLALSPEERGQGTARQLATTLLRQMQGQGFVLSYSLFDRNGNVVLSTLLPPDRLGELPQHLGINRADPNYLSRTMLVGDAYISPVIYAEDNSPGVYFVARVANQLDAPLGVIVAHYHLSNIQTSFMVANNNLAGPGSYPILLDDNGLHLGHGRAPTALNTLLSLPEPTALATLKAQRRVPNLPDEEINAGNAAFAEALRTSGTQPFFSVPEQALQAGQIASAAAARVATRNWTVIYIQAEEVLLAPVNTQARNTLLLAVVIAGVTILAATLLAQLLTRPIGRLTGLAQRVAAGDLDVRVPVQSQDEIGTLSQVFNEMTAQLRQTLVGLEERIAERTRDLEAANQQSANRSAQLEAITLIANAIATERDLGKLLPLITEAISERLGFYHVGIFLVDAASGYAVLRAANSEGGQRMLARSHRLRVGQEGIIGYVTARGEARISLDVGADAVFFNNPDLPQTRSEMGLPLRTGGHVIGALDVQSTQAAAFKQEDIALLTILAEQVATAIENATLFSETRRALEEVETVQRAYLRQQWSRRQAQTGQAGYAYDHGQLKPLRAVEAQPARPADPVVEAETLALPIRLRGEVIGALELNHLQPGRAWSEDELLLARSVVEQAGLALENARLIEETQRRAERETLVAEITTRLRQSNDPQTILQTVVAELRQALAAQRVQVLLPQSKPEKEPPQ